MIRPVILAALAAICADPATAQQNCYRPGDIDTNGTVDLADYALVWSCLAGPDVDTPPAGCGAGTFGRCDLDGDADVDLADGADFTRRFPLTYFDYGPHRENLEAEMLAMNLAAALRAPDEQYERILRDLALIRAAYPQLTTVIDDPDYVPNQLIVGLQAGQPTDGYEGLNFHYYVVQEEVYTWGRVLTFCDNLNAVVLAVDYADLPEVGWAEPNYFIGHDDQITVSAPSTVYRYVIDDGFLDCFDGCDCHRVWTLDVDAAGTVTLRSYEEWGMSWCEF